jgi:hypothetical protein
MGSPINDLWDIRLYVIMGASMKENRRGHLRSLKGGTH